jgi:hypothetical protein
MKKYLFWVMILLVVPFCVSAQESNSLDGVIPSEDIVVGETMDDHPIVNQQVISKPPLDVSISNVHVDNAKHKLIMNLSVKNNTKEFVDGVVSYIELFKGDKLAEEGELFEPLEFVYYVKQDIDKFAPNQEIKKEIIYDVPQLKSGKYFIRNIFEDSESEYFGITYTPEPIIIEGNGNFKGAINAYVKAPNDKLGMPMSGYPMDNDQYLEIVIKADGENKDFFDYIDNNEIYTKIDVYALSMDNKFIKSFEKQRIKTTTFDNTRAVVLRVEPWDELATGSYNVVLQIFDKDGYKAFSDTLFRWFRSEGVARIKKIVQQQIYIMLVIILILRLL